MLSMTDPANLRTELANALGSASTTSTSWQLGQRADTLSCAFLIGYQAAMRCLNPTLDPNTWAAFCVSERGVKNPFDMTTRYDHVSKRLEGSKSHVMLADKHLIDELYIVARQITDDSLCALKVPMDSVSAESAIPQAFLPELLHSPIRFDVTLTESALYSTDAHREMNKPFRYWEDVHLCLALGGWMCARIANSERLTLEANALQNAFAKHNQQYDLASLNAVEHFLAVLRDEAMQLSDMDANEWSRDTLLLKFSQPIRAKIRAKLAESA